MWQSISDIRIKEVPISARGGIETDSIYELANRGGGYKLSANSVQVTGAAGTITTNVFTFTGQIEILAQFARIASITTLTNCTDVYADAYD